MRDVGRMTFSSAGTLAACNGRMIFAPLLAETCVRLHLWETLLYLCIFRQGYHICIFGKRCYVSIFLKPCHLCICGKPCYVCILREAMLRLHQRKPCHFTSSNFGALSFLGNPATSASLRNLARPVHL